MLSVFEVQISTSVCSEGEYILKKLYFPCFDVAP